MRGVPLITVLFMASVMLPLFVPEAYSPDKLLRALIGIAMFASAYMAEVVRAGLQAIPKGQYEGAMAVGLGYWQMMWLIILPQALQDHHPEHRQHLYRPVQGHDAGLHRRHLRSSCAPIEVSRIDPKWAAPTTSATGYAFAAIVLFHLLLRHVALRQERRKRGLPRATSADPKRMPAMDQATP